MHTVYRTSAEREKNNSSERVKDSKIEWDSSSWVLVVSTTALGLLLLLLLNESTRDAQRRSIQAIRREGVHQNTNADGQFYMGLDGTKYEYTFVVPMLSVARKS
jgi:hypothetical protein